MAIDQPLGESEQGLLERLGNALVPEEPAPSVEASQPKAETPEAEETEEVTQEADEQPVDDGLVELEVGEGEVYRVPQKLKEGYMRTADYTRKTQDLAALQKQAQFSITERQIAQEFEKETKDDRTKLLQVQAAIQQEKTQDWTNLDTDTLVRKRARIDELKEYASDLEKVINEKGGAVRQKLAAARQQSVQNAYEFIGRHVKGFTPESDVERGVTRYAQSLGVPSDALAEIAVMFPGVAVAVAKAEQFDRLQSNKTVITKQAQKAPPVIKPGAVNNQASQRTADKQLRQQIKKTGDINSLARWLEGKI